MFADLQKFWKEEVKMVHFSLSSLSVPPFSLELFCGFIRDVFAAYVPRLAKMLYVCGRPLGAETKIELVSSAYVASCQCLSSYDLVIGSIMLTK